LQKITLLYIKTPECKTQEALALDPDLIIYEVPCDHCSLSLLNPPVNFAQLNKLQPAVKDE